MSNNSNITHKELLAFSNLTNLEWEYVQLELESNDESEMQMDTVEPRYHKLNDLLDPKMFAREETDPYTGDKRTIPVYGEGEEGIAQLRQRAGIAMEYLEKIDSGNKEGDFLKDWEVIFGADKYKIMEDYLDQRWEPVQKLLNEYINELKAQEESSEISEEIEDIKEEKKELEAFLSKKPYPSREELTNLSFG